MCEFSNLFTYELNDGLLRTQERELSCLVQIKSGNLSTVRECPFISMVNWHIIIEVLKQSLPSNVFLHFNYTKDSCSKPTNLSEWEFHSAFKVS